MGTWVITGGGSGIGKQLVDDLLAANEKVIAWDIAPPAEPSAAHFDKVDLTQVDQIRAAAGRIEGSIDAFIHCAGIIASTSLAHDNLVEKMRACFDVHVLAFVVTVQALLDKFTPGKGAIVAITSAGMDMVYPGTLAYGASKAALQRTIEQLAVELGGMGIRVNGVAPGAIATPMTQHMWENPEFANERKKFIPLGRQSDSKAVSKAIRFLASDEADYVTGETLWVDGGVRHGIFQTGVRDFIKNAKPG